jgi:peptidoglycan/xylan/chitin deacetylase (PgdA/CDA1 family)
MTRKRKIAIVVAVIVVLLAAFPGRHWWTEDRQVGWRDAINPAYWMRRARGEDLYSARQRLLYHGNRSLREIAITIDDGPHAETDPGILDTLRRLHVRATFFVVGENMKKHPELVRRMVAEGHEAGNHTQTHLRLNQLTSRQIRNEINNCDINFNRATGRHFALLRPPGLHYDDRVLRQARDLGYILVGKTWAARDYTRATPESLVRGARRRAENGAIFLFHDEYPETVAALPRIIESLRREGYRFVTISEMLAHLPKPVVITADPKARPMAKQPLGQKGAGPPTRGNAPR